jgi:signal transduction histidine kinase
MHKTRDQSCRTQREGVRHSPEPNRDGTVVGPEPPRIHISAKQAGPFWVFSISDNGIGIEREHQERIFLMFQRLHDRARYPGIGLAICKRIVDRMGGQIWVESEVSKGSTFYFTVPATARHNVAPEKGLEHPNT